MNKICVIGLGYIGLPTAANFSASGIEVVGLEVNQAIIKTVNSGKCHFSEPKLERVVKRCVEEGKLRATLQPEMADAFIITVPTPLTQDNKADLKYIESAVKLIAPVIQDHNLIVLESTSPVGTTEKVVEWLVELRPDLKSMHTGKNKLNINVAYCPERVLPGKIMEELTNNDRIIGGITKECANRAMRLYKTFVKGECFITDARTAELSKLTENAFRDVNIAFANEMSVICSTLNIDVWEVIRLANRHPRVNILNPGCGVGGHCIAVDPWFIVDSAPNASCLIPTARKVNKEQELFVVKKIKQAVANIEAPVIACLGLSYKPNVGDIRESAAVAVVNVLAKECDYSIYVVEPNISTIPPILATHRNVKMVDLETAIKHADLIALMVAHKDFEQTMRKTPDGKSFISFVGDSF